MSRKIFIRGVVAGGVVLGVGGLVEWRQQIDGQRQNNLANFEDQQMKLFDQQVKAGMSGDWFEAAVWPGLAIIPSDVELYGTAALLKDSRIEWPETEQSDHLAVQRPFLINQSASLNQEPITHNPQNGNDDVLGFWLPGSQQLAFCDRTAYQDQILLPTHSEAAIYTDNYSGIVGEQVDLEFPVTREDLTWRYIKAKISDGFGDSSIVTKVIGRSQWLDSGEVAVNYYAFQTGEGNDLVQLPEAK